MIVNVWRYSDEEDPFETYNAQDAGLIGENTIQIHEDDATITIISGFYKFRTILTDEELAILEQKRQEAAQLTQMREFGNKFSV